MNDILSQIIAYSPNKIDTEKKARAMVPGPRNMKLAEVPRSEMDNFNTPDLEQSPNSFLRPGETLEDFDVEFRRPNAQGGRIGFKDGTPVKFDKTRVKIPTGKFIGEGRDKSQIFKIKNNNSGSIKYMTSSAGGGKKKLYNSIEEVKKAKLDFIPDELVKTDAKRIKENIQEVTYKNKKTGKITTKYKPFIGPDKVTIPGQGANTLKEAEGFVADYFKKNPKTIRVRDPQKDYASKDVRKKVLKETDPTRATGTKKFNYHHVRQIAGGVPLTTDDVLIINQRINSSLATNYDKPLNAISAAIQKNNKLALEAMNAKNEGLALDYMKRVDELNTSAEKIVNSAIDKLPKKYKGYVGFNQFTLPRNEYGLPISNEPMIIKKVGGMPVSKDAIDLTTLNLKQEKEFRKIVKAQAESGKTGSIKNISAIQSKGIAKKLDAAGFKCQLSNGLTCNDPRAYTKSIKENMAKIQQGDDAAIAKLNKLGKGMNAFKGAAKFTGWGLLAELGIAAPLAAVDYAKGANKDEIISNATYGLFGKSEDEQLREKYSDYGQAKDFQKTYDKLLKQENALDDQTGYGPIINPQNVKNTEKKLMEQSKQFDSVLPPSQGLRSEFDLGKFLNMVVTDQQRDKLFADQKAQREKERGILKPSTGLESYDNFMEGGIASLNVKK